MFSGSVDLATSQLFVKDIEPFCKHSSEQRSNTTTAHGSGAFDTGHNSGGPVILISHPPNSHPTISPTSCCTRQSIASRFTEAIATIDEMHSSRATVGRVVSLRFHSRREFSRPKALSTTTNVLLLWRGFSVSALLGSLEVLYRALHAAERLIPNHTCQLPTCTKQPCTRVSSCATKVAAINDV